jgi:hypothetical protein
MYLYQIEEVFMKIVMRITMFWVLTALLFCASCDNPAGEDDKKKETVYLISGQFNSSYSAGTALFYADYINTAVKSAVSSGDSQGELKGKIEDGDIVFSLAGFMGEDGMFSLSAGSSMLVYQITGKLRDNALEDTKVIIQIKNGDRWVEHEEQVIRAENVNIIKPDSPAQISSAVPFSWQGGWQGKAAGAGAYDTWVLTPFSIIVYPQTGTTGIISLLETEARGGNTVDFVILGYDNDELTPVYYKCSLMQSGTVLRFNTYLSSKIPVMSPGALQAAKAYNTAADNGSNVRVVAMSKTDRTSLGAIIGSAVSAKDKVVVSADGGDVLSEVYWVSAAQMNAFNEAIAAAETVYNDIEADQTRADNAVTALQNAVAAFDGQKQAGTVTKAMYVLGGYWGDFPSGAYWKDGVRQELSGSDGVYSLEGIGLSGNDLYITGGGYYWKNGVRYDLPFPPGATGFTSRKIAVSASGDVYIAGSYTSVESNWQGCYWKNGNRTDIPSCIHVEDIILSGNDLYILGLEGSGTTGTAFCYWKNNVKNVVDSVGIGEAIAVSGSDVYIAGGYSYYDSISDSTNYKPCYWKNGIKYYLPSEGFGLAAYMVILGTDVYIAGRADGNAGCYWFNETKYTLNGGGNSRVSGMCTDDNDVYILGEYLNGDDFTSCYWKNGVRVDLPAEIRMPSAIMIK